MEVVPECWFLTRISQSRIFQQMTVPAILKAVFTGLNVEYRLRGHYEPRDYCVQYRETDFHFASRLMEEEGIFYFFEPSPGDQKMVVGDSPEAFPKMQGTVIFDEEDGGNRGGVTSTTPSPRGPRPRS
jgi:type VI secretion system secreted protein VgrG